MNCGWPPGLGNPRGIVSVEPGHPLRIVDRYLVRETIPPFLLALGVSTFMLAIQPMLPQAQLLLAKNVPLPTVAFCLLLLLPSALGLTIPIAYLVGTLLALGRWSTDHEAVALLACGVNPNRLIRPILVMALVAMASTAFVMMELLPDANQKYREVTFPYITQKTEAEIKPRLFYEGLPGKVIYLLDRQPDGSWSNVLLADVSRPDHLAFDLAQRGELILDPVARTGAIDLTEARRYAPGANAGTYSTSQVASERFPVSPESIFGPDAAAALSRGLPEMHIPELLTRIDELASQHQPMYREELYLQQKFSFPAACLVFGFLALPIGLHTRKEGRLTGMALGLLVLLAYMALQNLGEGQASAQRIPAWSARWVPNFVLLPLGFVGVWWRSRTTGQGITLRVPQWMARRRRAPTPAQKSGKSAAILVIRMPALQLPRPRLLDLYVGTRYVRLFVLTLASLMTLFYLGNLIDASQRFFKSHATGWMLAKYLAYQTPQFAYYAIPIAALVAAVSTIAALTRSSELTVMRACGVSLYRVAAPVLLISLVWSGALFYLEERVLPRSNRTALRLEDVIRGRPPRPDDLQTRNWLAGTDGVLYYYEGFDRSASVLLGLNVLETATSPYRLVSHTYARRVLYRNGAWTAEAGWAQRFPTPTTSTRETFANRTLTLPPRDNFVATQVPTDDMTVTELHDYISRLDASGFSIAEQLVAFHHKLAFPLVTLVVTLIGVPFGITTGRRGTLFGIGIGVGLALAYWLLDVFFVAAGSAGLLPTPLAAWAANLLFLALAGYLLLTART
jgi:LPS export ABC transporter permease LptG/LPS export ABC transporter permease LptF